jgi:mRNA interferase RelE/StbE
MPDKITKFIESLDSKTRVKLKKKLLKLKRDPYGMKDVKKIQGAKDIYRLRMGKIRILYQIIGNEVYVIDIDFRGNIY